MEATTETKTAYELGVACAEAAIAAGAMMADLIGVTGGGEWFAGDIDYLRANGVDGRAAWTDARDGWNDTIRAEARSIVDAHEGEAGTGADWIVGEPVSEAIRQECERRGIDIVVE